MPISVNGANGITFADGSIQNTGAAGFGFKNRIINGAMVIDQRSAGAANTTAETYAMDRWYTQNGITSGTVTTQQVIDAPAGFYYSAKKTFTGVAYNSTGGYANLQQSIEVNNIFDLAYGTASASPVTVSFWVKSSVTGAHSFCLQNYTSSRRSYLTSYTINAANTWEYKSITIPGDTAFGLSTTVTAIGLQVRFSQGAGTQYTGATSGSWITADNFFLSGCVTPATTSGATWQVTGVQLEKGSTATAFDYRDYGREFQMCQRYFLVWSNGSGNIGLGGYYNSTYVTTSIGFPVTMRAAPTLTQTTGTSYYGIYSNNTLDYFDSFSSGIQQATVSCAGIDCSTNVSGTSGALGRVVSNAGSFIGFSAEL